MAESDILLIAGVLKGDRAAFGLLYDKYAALVRAICYDETKNMTDAQDMAQEVFLRAYAKLAGLKDRDRFAPWLVSIAKNVCREYRKKRARDRHVLTATMPDDILPQQDPPDERLAELQAAISKLPEKERMAIRTFYLGGEDADQARRLMQVSRSAFYRILQRARENLKKNLDE